MRHFEKLADLADLVGSEIGVSDWIEIDQARIQRFADATDDQQWIHTDPVLAAQGPFGTTVAHGFLTLSLVPYFFESAFSIGDVRMGLNYGLNKVRFPAPVPVGSRLRARFRLTEYQPIPGGAQMVAECTVEREGSEKPVMVAETVSRRMV